jgi:hypothetical protein
MDYLRDREVLLRGPVGDHMRFATRTKVPEPAALTPAG